MPPGWFSDLFSKRKGTDSDSVSADEENNPQTAGSWAPPSSGNPQSVEYDDPDDAPVSPLAMMNEKSPEAWLGQFLTILGAPPALQYSTIRAAKQDARLSEHLRSVLESAGKDDPIRLLDPGYAASLKARDWAAWWRATEALGHYSYAILSLIMLGDTSHNSDLAAMYRQETNSRIRKDAQYVISYVLGKDWPGYNVTESDLARLSAS